MIGAYIVLSAATLILFVLAQDVYVRISYDEELEVSFNFVLLAFTLSQREKKEKKKKKKRNSGKKPGREFYFTLLRRISYYAEGCEVIIKRLCVPRITFGREGLPLPEHDFGWSASLFIAYLDSKATKLTIDDNALTLSPDGKIVIDLSFKSSYFSMILFMIRLWRDYRKNQTKREIENVGK